jgi:hypothetical protein
MALAAAAVLVAAGVRAGAEWDVYPGRGNADSGCDLRRRGGGTRFMCTAGRMPGNVNADNRVTRKIYEKPTIHSYRFIFKRI